MTMTAEAAHLFEDARNMNAAALERLAAGDIRDAAEKAWCATKRATDGLLLASTETAPQTANETSRGIRTLSGSSPAAHDLRVRYFDRQAALHGACFYDGMCEPIADTEQLIHQTSKYIQDAERLAA